MAETAALLVFEGVLPECNGLPEAIIWHFPCEGQIATRQSWNGSRAGYAQVGRHDFLSRQYFLVFQAR
jgi:hypothetical protein